MMMLRNTNPLLLAAFLAAGTPGCVSKLTSVEVNDEALVRNAVGSFDSDLGPCVVDGFDSVRRFNSSTITGEHKPSHVLPCEVTALRGVNKRLAAKAPFRWGIDHRAAPTGEIGWPSLSGSV
jgi:hypothetical protein